MGLAARVHLGHLALPIVGPLLAGALGWRFLLGPAGLLGELNTEESVVGLMARALWRGSLPELWVWGQPGMAALEPLGAAATFSLFGEGTMALRLIPFLITSLATVGTLAMVGRWLHSRATVPAVLMMLVAFPGTTEALCRALGGVSAGLFCGVVGLGGAAQVSLTRPGRLSLASGVLLGLGLYTHPGMLAFAGAGVALVLLAVSRMFWQPAYLLIGLGHLIRLALGLALGGLPVWLTTGLDGLWAAETRAVSLDTVTGVDALGHFLLETLGGRSAPVLLLAVVVVAIPGLVVATRQRGLEDAGVRLVLGALFTVVLSGLHSLAATPVSASEAVLRALPGVMMLPVLVGAAAFLPWTEALCVLCVGGLLWSVDPSRLPRPRDVGATIPVGAVKTFLDAHPGTRCYAAASVAYRVALLSGGNHHCVSILGPDYIPAWRADAASGMRAYFFAPEEAARARALDVDLRRLKRPRRATTAGAFFVRITEGTAYPPVVPTVVTEHGRRDRRALIDGDLETGVVARAGQQVPLDLVWPTPLLHVSYWQDVTRLARAPCRVQANILLETGKVEAGPEVSLMRTCDMARRWALWPMGSLEVRLPLPAHDAVQVRLESLDDSGLLAATEVRVTARSKRLRETTARTP